LEGWVREGGIGELRFIEATARLNLAYQGTHALEMVCSFNGGARPTHVIGQVAGECGLAGTKGHHAPDESVASIAFDNGVRAQLLCGGNAPAVGAGPEHTHKRIAVYGTRGLVQWTMKGWERSGAEGSIEAGSLDYAAQDVLAQAALTEAAFDWLEDDRKVHPTNLQSSLEQFNVVLGIYASALGRAGVALPVEPEPDLIEKLRAAL
jgi:predicted dehydrogenase